MPEGYAPGTRISVEIFPAEGQSNAVEASLRADGATDVVRIGQVVSAKVPVSSLSRIAGDPRINWTQSASVPVAEVTGEGVAFTGADLWHAAGFTGSGVSVAVIDGGFAGYSSLLGTELPASVQTANFCDAGLTTATDHGTAVAEVVHEVAPDATLHLVCIDDSGDLSQAVTYAVGAGVTIISHSIGWFNTGRGDGSGLLQPIVQAARDGGILWINSGGNYAEKHWSGTFSDTDADDIHEFFGGTDETNDVEVPAGGTIDVLLRWDDWPTTSLDYDLWLFDSGLNPVWWSREDQTAGAPPVESLSYTNPGPTSIFHVVITKFAGPATTPQMNLFMLGAKQPCCREDLLPDPLLWSSHPRVRGPWRTSLWRSSPALEARVGRRRRWPSAHSPMR